MMWHVVYAEPGRLPQSRAARSREAAIHSACELLGQSYDVRRVIEPNGAFIEQAELAAHYDEGHFPGLHRRPQIGGDLERELAPSLPSSTNRHAWTRYRPVLSQ
jgi:hypothetical protein